MTDNHDVDAKDDVDDVEDGDDHDDDDDEYNDYDYHNGDRTLYRNSLCGNALTYNLFIRGSYNNSL